MKSIHVLGRGWRGWMPVAVAVTVCFSLLGTADAKLIFLTGTLRDFHDTHPDMQIPNEDTGGLDLGIVGTVLGGDGKPVYAGGAGTQTTHGAAAFNQWYNDVGGVNVKKPETIALDNTITPDPNVYTFDRAGAAADWFPLDGILFGNEGRAHNFYMTYELHSNFTYQGGETFAFAGDDDLWLFIAGQRVIDLGGVHFTETDSVDLDTLGLTLGNTYNFDLFWAERHTSDSNFRIDTSIALRTGEIPEPATLALLGLSSIGLAGYRRLRRRRRA